jgi:hypothetical protein
MTIFPAPAGDRAVDGSRGMVDVEKNLQRKWYYWPEHIPIHQPSYLEAIQNMDTTGLYL